MPVIAVDVVLKRGVDGDVVAGGFGKEKEWSWVFWSIELFFFVFFRSLGV